MGHHMFRTALFAGGIPLCVYAGITEPQIFEKVIAGTGVVACTYMTYAQSYLLTAFHNNDKRPYVIEQNGDSLSHEPVAKNKYALIVRGNPGGLFDVTNHSINSCNLVRNTLIETGYPERNIYSVDSIGRLPASYQCTKKNLNLVIGDMARRLSPEDKLYVHIDAHGYPEKEGESSFTLQKKEVMKESELEDMLSQLNPNHTIYYLNNCFSGGFAKRMAKGNSVAMATSHANKVTGCYVGRRLRKKFGNHTSAFTFYFFSSLRGKMPDGESMGLQDLSLLDSFKVAAELQESTSGTSWLNFGRNTPHLYYSGIDPLKVTL